MLGDSRSERLGEAVQPVLLQAERLHGDELYQAPHEGDWSPMRILAHIAELVPYWARQAAELARRDQDDLPFGRTADDPDRIAAVEDHHADGLDEALSRLRSGLAEAVVVLRALPEAGWSRTGRHPRRGQMTVQQVVDDFLLDHLDEHAAQLDRTIRALRGRPGPS